VVVMLQSAVETFVNTDADNLDNQELLLPLYTKKSSSIDVAVGEAVKYGNAGDHIHQPSRRPRREDVTQSNGMKSSRVNRLSMTKVSQSYINVCEKI
jgi:hypothetical protein